MPSDPNRFGPPTMPPPSARPLTLIVAATPKPILTPPLHKPNQTPLGIGLNGTLPWPRIKWDMNFFARVTSRQRSPPPGPEHAVRRTTNAIIMGRKTYLSLPPRIRPLNKRINVVLTRSDHGLGLMGEIEKELSARKAESASRGESEDQRDVLVASGLEDALAKLDARDRDEGGSGVGEVFVIGGAEVYASALRLGRPQTRILMTCVRTVGSDGGDGGQRPFECDTVFPLTLEELSDPRRWREVGPETVSSWAGESVEPGWRREGNIELKVVGYEMVSSSEGPT
ncbi:hypothetical protein VTN31DRAFT_309 [Thermomyces dupontii]|uniref:uncharacterized protein n=1 Tax=Talaromyces thermophilus TaxID=28565 RepID=UPI0037438EB4